MAISSLNLVELKAEKWISDKGLTSIQEKFSLGFVTVVNDKIAFSIFPKAKSTEALVTEQERFRQRGIKLYYIYPWEEESLDKILIHFSSKLELSSRTFAAKRLLCEIITNKQADEFMRTYHIQGSARGTDKVSISLRIKDTKEVLAIQQFSKHRWGIVKGQPRNESKTWEGLRLCFLPDVKIHGGATRMEKKFETAYKPEKIISYINRSHSEGDYKSFQGFTEITSVKQNSFIWALDGQPKTTPIIDKNGISRLNDLNASLTKSFLNPASVAGAFGKGVGELFYGGRLGSRAQLRVHAANGLLVQNETILEAIGYHRYYTAGQRKWEKTFNESPS